MNQLTSDLISFIKISYSPEENIKTLKDGRETIFYRKSGKSLCYIETKDGKSVITVIIGASLNDLVQSANISKKTKTMFGNAKQFHDGKWLFFEISSKEDLEDIKTLLKIKRKSLQS